MKLFTDLYVELDQTNKTNEKVEAMRFYFRARQPHDAAWALYFLSGRKPRQIVPSKFLREWALELSGIPEWLYEESRDTVGDGAETMALSPAKHDGRGRDAAAYSGRGSASAAPRLEPETQYEAVTRHGRG